MHRSALDSKEEEEDSTVSIRCFTFKKWTLALCIFVEIVEAIVAIVIAAVHYSKVVSSSSAGPQEHRELSGVQVALVLWSLVALVRLIFLYGVLCERFWLCLAYAVISFGHIVILATTGDSPNWPWVLFTALLTIVSLLYVMDQFLLRQEQSEKEQKLAEERKHVQQQQQQIYSVNNNNDNNSSNLNSGATDIKYVGTLV